MSVQDPWVIVGLVAGVVLALAGLFRPFLGLLVLFMLHFIQPGELVPALIPIHIERIYGAALLVAFLVYRISRPSPSLLSNRVVFASILLLGVACLTIPLAIWRGGAFWSTVELIKNVILLVLITSLVNSNDRMRMVLWMMVGLLGWFAASGLISYLHGEFSFQEGIERAEGVNSIAGGPNELAGLLLALLPFLIALFRSNRNIFVRIGLIGCGGLALTTQVLTGSRAALIAAVALAVYYVARSKHKVLAFALFAISAFALWCAMPQEYRQRYLTIKNYAEGAQLDASNELRLMVWKAGWRMFLDHPILGVGAGQFPTAYGTIYSGRLHTAWMNPHNLFLQVVCELGLIGLIVFVYFLAQIIKQIRSVLKTNNESKSGLNYQVAVACGAMFLGTFVLSLVSHSLYRPYWYMLAGLVAANHSILEVSLNKQIEAAPGDEEGVSREDESRLSAAPFFMSERG